MEIIKEEFNGIKYYLVDIYETEFSFGVVYHFVSNSGDKKFCFYKDNTYIPIKNKIHLRKIEKELKINLDILFREKTNEQIDNKRNSDNLSNTQRLSKEEEYLLYDESAKVIHESFPDIPYEESMEILNDDKGIYYAELEGTKGRYYHRK